MQRHWRTIFASKLKSQEKTKINSFFFEKRATQIESLYKIWTTDNGTSLGDRGDRKETNDEDHRNSKKNKPKHRAFSRVACFWLPIKALSERCEGTRDWQRAASYSIALREERSHFKVNITSFYHFSTVIKIFHCVQCSINPFKVWWAFHVSSLLRTNELIRLRFYSWLLSILRNLPRSPFAFPLSLLNSTGWTADISYKWIL